MRTLVSAALASAFFVPGALAQVSGLSDFNAPYRAFQRHEAGFSVTFPGYDDTAIQGLYRFGTGSFDIGLRGGVWFIRNRAIDDEILILGAEARQRVITATDEFPLDGALIFGGGLQIGPADNFIPTIGLSVGRRVDIEDSDVSIVLYAEPAAWLFIGDANEELEFALGLGADLRISPRFDLRVSVGIGDIEGLSISAVWVR